MEKFYTIDFEVEYCEDNCMEGNFNEKTVIKEVEEFLKSRYGDKLKWFVINENENGLKEIYNSKIV